MLRVSSLLRYWSIYVLLRTQRDGIFVRRGLFSNPPWSSPHFLTTAVDPAIEHPMSTGTTDQVQPPNPDTASPAAQG